MKVLFVIQCTNLGGMEHNALMLIDEFKRMGIESEVLSLNEVGLLGSVLRERGVPATGLKYRGPWGIGAYRELKKILARIKADGMVMIGHNLMAMAAIGDCWRQHRVLSIHFHHSGVKPNWQWRLIYRIAQARFRTVLFVSQYIMNEAISIAPFLQSNSLLISTPVALNQIADHEAKKVARARLGLPATAKIVGNAGWLTVRKRWDVFLDVAGRVGKNIDDAVFVIAGDGPERRRLEEQANRLGIAPKVRWLGWVENLKDFYHAVDVLLFNSDADAQARTPLEAMSYGVPVVASLSEGGTTEVITNDSVGILIKRHDIQALGEQVERLLRNQVLRESMARAAHNRIAEYGDPKAHAERVLRGLGFA